ncbi:hypothetical protein [Helicobacter cetorum]|nr:hypothetical protein [Helicobacter cetorum]
MILEIVRQSKSRGRGVLDLKKAKIFSNLNALKRLFLISAIPN